MEVQVAQDIQEEVGVGQGYMEVLMEKQEQEVEVPMDLEVAYLDIRLDVVDAFLGKEVLEVVLDLDVLLDIREVVALGYDWVPEAPSKGPSLETEAILPYVFRDRMEKVVGEQDTVRTQDLKR